MATQITQLPQDVIDAIAAGETIERPAFVIKELIENALDAEATKIEIMFRRSGMETIQVYDNGIGISKENLAKAVLPHYTSKIKTLQDLDQITSLGFRGEALASIARVSSMAITSRPKNNDIGYQLVVEQTQLSQPTKQAMNSGTLVQVERLFTNVPVRRKFLTNLQREKRHIVEVVTNHALARPDVQFTLREGNKLLLDLPSQSLAQRIAQLFGTETSKLILPITYKHSFVSISGFIGKPQLGRKYNRYQYLSLNKRPVYHAQISSTLKKAFGSLLSPGSTPWFVVQIELPSSVFDVNVHPRKEAVSFLDESQVISLLNKAVVRTLSELDSGYRYDPAPSSVSLKFRDRRTPLPVQHKLLKKAVVPWSPKPSDTSEVLQVASTYLVFRDDDGMHIIDQHAAHERILYEQFKREFESQNADTDDESSQLRPRSVELQPSYILNLDENEASAWQECEQTLKQLGFDWSEFGPNSYAINRIPKQLENHDLDQVIPDVLDDLVSNAPLQLSNDSHRTLAYLACRSAIMAGDPLSTEEASNLIKQLSQTINNSTCPHGRPTKISFDISTIEKLFNRR